MRADDCVFFVGAGISIPLPAGGPLFTELRTAGTALAAGRWNQELNERQKTLLENVVPEVFLKEFVDAGYDLAPAMVQAVHGSPGTGPNPVHRLLAEQLAAGRTVFTTNWDRFIESAAIAAGHHLELSVYPHLRDGSQLYKVHGSIEDPESLLFASPDVLRPIAPPWQSRLVDLCRGGTLIVAGYAGADVDLYDALHEAVAAARRTLWLEGLAGADYSRSPAPYAAWRYGLATSAFALDNVPTSGAHLLWCGDSRDAGDPSTALLRMFGDVATVAAPPDRGPSARRVHEAIAAAGRAGPRSKRLAHTARTNVRLGRRWTSLPYFAAAVVTGRGSVRRRAVSALTNLAAQRTGRTRGAVNRILMSIQRRPGRREFLRTHAGILSSETDDAIAAASDPSAHDPDDAMTASMNNRWVGDLRVSERIGRTQLERVLAIDLSDESRDWPERVSRATFELAQSLIWQGRFLDADDILRSGYLRITGAKWTAWELSLRAVVRFVHGEIEEAHEQLATAVDLLDAEGLRGFLATSLCQQAACRRERGEMRQAADLITRAASEPNLGSGSLAAIDAERGEIALAIGDEAGARAHWERLAATALPMWSAIGQLRLAEIGVDPQLMAMAAGEKFELVGNRWGTIRSGMVLMGDADPPPGTEQLGPLRVFRPGGPWMM